MEWTRGAGGDNERGSSPLMLSSATPADLDPDTKNIYTGIIYMYHIAENFR